MSEIIVISDDDLEEGEIADDVPEPVVLINCKPKEKKLPRRYILHENKDLNSNQTKHRKHTSRHHRKHHKSCPRHSLERHKFTVKQLGHKISSSSQSDHRKNLNSHTLSVPTVKSAFKNFSSPCSKPVTSIRHNSTNQLPSKNVDNFQQMLTSEKSSTELKDKVENLNGMDIQKEKHSLPKCVNESLNDELNLLPTKPNPHECTESEKCSDAKVNNEESEDDEEELRRIALSTCLKRPVKDLKPAASFCNVNNTDENSCQLISVVVSKGHSTYSSDNYEVVDMELDDDSLTEDVNSDGLFIIDRNPLISESHEGLPGNNFNLNHNVDVISSKINDPSLENELHLPSSQCQSNDNFEEELLRAEVIASMNSAHPKPSKVPEKKLPLPKNGSQTEVQIPLSNKVQSTDNVVARSFPTYCRPPMTNFLNITRKRVVNKAKLHYSKLTSHKKVSIPPQRKINAGPERLVITLNNDSSSDESNEDCEKDKDENVAVASIEALISDARQKSDIQKTNSNNSINLSCLSKAQQEEYNTLKKILAEKQVLPKRSTTIPDKRTLHLKMLAKKISNASDNLNKERKMLIDVEKELLIRKKDYMASKLKVQHLKEQLHAAELIRAANLESWKKSAAKLDIQKKSVTKHEAIVDLLEKKLNTKSQPQVQNLTLSPIQKNGSLAT